MMPITPSRLAKALLDGGIDCMELTLRTSAAIEGLRQVSQQVPNMLAGIGTILSTQQIDAVSEAGTSFGVAPGLNPRVVRHAQQKQLPFAPGIATPSDIEAAIELGCRQLKFFPAQPIGGLTYLRSISTRTLTSVCNTSRSAASMHRTLVSI